jgi:hypothetical protein
MTTDRKSFAFSSEYGDCICNNVMWEPIKGYLGRIFPPTQGRLEISYEEDEQA